VTVGRKEQGTVTTAPAGFTTVSYPVEHGCEARLRDAPTTNYLIGMKVRCDGCGAEYERCSGEIGDFWVRRVDANYWGRSYEGLPPLPDYPTLPDFPTQRGF
jgi:hypothetical protein